MKKEGKALSPGTHVGFISLLMIVLVVCLAIFISLTFRSVNADNALTDRTGNTVSTQYAAHNRCQEFLADLDALLFDMDCVDTSALREVVFKERLLPLLNEDITYDGGNGIINAYWQSGERLFLYVTIKINMRENGARYSVISVETITVTQEH